MSSGDTAGFSASGFTLVLPADWVTLDLNPETADQSVRRVVDGIVRAHPASAERRAVVEELLSTMTKEAIADGKLLCGVRFWVDEQGRPVQALVSVALQEVDGPTDPGSLFERFADEDTDGRMVSLEWGPALRVRARSEGFMSWGLFIGVPGSEGVVAVLSLLSPSLEHEDQLDAFFDGLVESFRFTGKDDAPIG
ncbi:MAG: hypothetical protein AB1679_06810 [Actinomycetota bacterium]